MTRKIGFDWAPVITLLLGFGMLAWALGSKSLWCDEIFTAEVANYPPAKLMSAVAADLHPPLYFLLISLWAKLLGTSEFALRLPSVFSAALGVCLVFQLGKLIGGRRTANISMCFLAFSPLFIEFSRDGLLLLNGYCCSA